MQVNSLFHLFSNIFGSVQLRIVNSWDNFTLRWVKGMLLSMKCLMLHRQILQVNAIIALYCSSSLLVFEILTGSIKGISKVCILNGCKSFHPFCWIWFNLLSCSLCRSTNCCLINWSMSCILLWSMILVLYLFFRYFTVNVCFCLYYIKFLLYLIKTSFWGSLFILCCFCAFCSLKSY